MNHPKWHPCFNEACMSSIKRLHLPVAPRCNIHCNFCDRQISCTSLQKPGIAKRILKITELKDYIKSVDKAKCVFGIAGPGEALYNEETFESLEILKDCTTCLCTNGLLLEEKIEKLVALNLNYLSITINSLDYKIATNIYDFVNYKGRFYEGIKGVKLLINKQIAGLQEASRYDLRVKVNTVYIPGVNDSQIVPISKFCQKYNVDIMNIIPVMNGRLRNINGESDDIKKLREKAAEYIPQKNHCAKCRADAYGYIGKGEEKIG
ncbi:MAG: radical SAM protein [Clostridia bacterium]|nr:radical SAM protein [Clostridia bacterium]